MMHKQTVFRLLCCGTILGLLDIAHSSICQDVSVSFQIRILHEFVFPYVHIPPRVVRFICFTYEPAHAVNISYYEIRNFVSRISLFHRL
jgi:hypothetical protein